MRGLEVLTRYRPRLAGRWQTRLRSLYRPGSVAAFCGDRLGFRSSGSEGLVTLTVTTVFAGRVVCRDTGPWLWSSALSWRSAISWRITTAENSWLHMMAGRELETHQMTASHCHFIRQGQASALDLRQPRRQRQIKHPPLYPPGQGSSSHQSITRAAHRGRRNCCSAIPHACERATCQCECSQLQIATRWARGLPRKASQLQAENSSRTCDAPATAATAAAWRQRPV